MYINKDDLLFEIQKVLYIIKKYSDLLVDTTLKDEYRACQSLEEKFAKLLDIKNYENYSIYLAINLRNILLTDILSLKTFGVFSNTKVIKDRTHIHNLIRFIQSHI
jgi:hypothetical protein